MLDAVREDIRDSGKLSPHYYEALKKGLYKPGAFFKGIIFPLLEVRYFSSDADANKREFG